MKIEMIAAVDDAWGIGRNGKIPWRVPGDMAFFRRQTLGHPTLMGRKTFESIGARPLVQRPCAVWTHFPERIACADDCYASSDLNALLAWCSRFDVSVFAIGGAEIYRAMLERSAVLWISRIPGCYGCNVFFPEISKHKLEKREIMDGFVLEKYILDCFE